MIRDRIDSVLVFRTFDFSKFPALSIIQSDLDSADTFATSSVSIALNLEGL